MKVKLLKIPKKQVPVAKIQTLTPTKAPSQKGGDSSGPIHFRRKQKPQGGASSQKDTSTFKKSGLVQKMIKQTQGVLPAELIVTGYHKSNFGMSNPTEMIATSEDKSSIYNTP